MKHLLELLQRIYNELRDENEINIIKKYGQLSRRYTAALITFIVGGLAMVSTGAILIAFIQHACGMFRISSYRIEHAMAIETAQSSNAGNGNMMYEGLIYAVDIHRKAMQFSDLSISKFKVSFFLLIVTGVACGSLNLLRIFQAVTVGYTNVGMLSIPLVFFVIHMIYMIVSNSVAQDIMDHNSHVFDTIYDVRWYVAPLNVQKMILFLLQRSTRVFSLNIGGIIVGSLENAATIFSTIVSYFTFFYSTWNKREI
ncbi:uncharacterized protein LOC105183320 isoform X3 [Harpegnathos saltator]|uniref:uncharacterized protein LOC105183320 isoform X3 n=1 Tax=Harpegnathos saltator TaxID=610380 RepID=UPI000DBEEA08|nr:uncharacterized protein LOC105183320 isoform X3 [Harpegnathos saltator]